MTGQMIAAIYQQNFTFKIACSVHDILGRLIGSVNVNIKFAPSVFVNLIIPWTPCVYKININVLYYYSTNACCANAKDSS